MDDLLKRLRDCADANDWLDKRRLAELLREAADEIVRLRGGAPPPLLTAGAMARIDSGADAPSTPTDMATTKGVDDDAQA